MISRHSCGGNKFHFYTATEIYPCVIYMECKTRMCTEQYNETVPHSSKKMSWPACCLECIVVILPAASRRAERTEVKWLKLFSILTEASDCSPSCRRCPPVPVDQRLEWTLLRQWSMPSLSARSRSRTLSGVALCPISPIRHTSFAVSPSPPDNSTL